MAIFFQLAYYLNKLLKMALFPVARFAAVVSNSSDNDFFFSNKVGEIIRKNGAAYTSVPTGTLSPQQRILGYTIDHVSNLVPKAYTQANFSGFIPNSGLKEFLDSLLKEFEIIPLSGDPAR